MNDSQLYTSEQAFYLARPTLMAKLLNQREKQIAKWYYSSTRQVRPSPAERQQHFQGHFGCLTSQSIRIQVLRAYETLPSKLGQRVQLIAADTANGIPEKSSLALLDLPNFRLVQELKNRFSSLPELKKRMYGREIHGVPYLGPATLPKLRSSVQRACSPAEPNSAR